MHFSLLMMWLADLHLMGVAGLHVLGVGVSTANVTKEACGLGSLSIYTPGLSR